LSAPGRHCPVAYRHGARALAGPAALEVDTLWLAGGLYGNPDALERLVQLYDAEPGSKALVFNGDFHWFDVFPEEFARIEHGVSPFLATRGNVESELAAPAEGAGCGCAYPEWVEEATVERSNRVIERLRATAAGFPQALERLARLPMHLVAAIGGERVAIVHGDADSLAGWAFSQEVLATAQGRAAARRAFAQADARIFASSHSCLPIMQEFAGGEVIANNGSAGMPNFRGTSFGLATRISVRPSAKPLYAARAAQLFVEALPVEYDAEGWRRRFIAQWPEGSAAFASYYERICNGPGYRAEQALRREAALAA
jgi:hypothetical protein